MLNPCSPSVWLQIDVTFFISVCICTHAGYQFVFIFVLMCDYYVTSSISYFAKIVKRCWLWKYPMEPCYQIGPEWLMMQSACDNVDINWYVGLSLRSRRLKHAVASHRVMLFPSFTSAGGGLQLASSHILVTNSLCLYLNTILVLKEQFEPHTNYTELIYSQRFSTY